MSDKKSLQDIFNDDPFGLLNIKPSTSPSRNEDERLIASFEEINDFFEKNSREPEQGGGIQEHQLYSRLKSLRENPTKMELLKSYDKFGLLNYEQKQINSLDDILNDDTMGLLDDDSEGLFDFKHVREQDERAIADFIARRKPCRDFAKYEEQFKEVQKDLSNGKRKLLTFTEDNLKAGIFYVHNGVLLLLENVDFEEEVRPFKSGSRIRKDGRTRVIFENGTESNMLYRSLYKALLANGKAVSENIDKVNEGFIEKFSNITDEDEEAGFIYILKSKSDKQEIREIQHLYKIGFSKIAVDERIKNASQEPTYLMADVRIVMAYKCYNMNPQKLELLLHNFFGNSCLNIDVFDKDGNRHTPREWFIAPLSVIEEAVKLIVSGDIVRFRYDNTNETIIKR
ncbi:MAG: GIY-YIG nuclease family protein [Nitrospirae bacterium]|nr:GIY-YIG nuclease family protein [Nitrospirota bacterium]